MESEKAHDLALANWGPRKAYDVIKLQSDGLQGASGLNPSPRTGEDEIYQLKKKSGDAKRGRSFLPLPFVSFRPSLDWMITIHNGEGNFPYWVHDSNANLIQKHPQRKKIEITFNLAI